MLMKELGLQTFKKAALVFNMRVALENVKKIEWLVSDIRIAHRNHNAALDPRERVYTQRKRIIITKK